MVLSLEPSARAMILAGLPLFPRVLPLGGSSHSPQGAPHLCYSDMGIPEFWVPLFPRP